MSPELAFALTLLLRMAVTAAFVVTASMITERSGPAIGALVATLPISAGPSYVFLALDHDPAFIAQGALTSLPINAATMFLSLTYVLVAQRRGVIVSLGAAVLVWFGLAAIVRMTTWSLGSALAVNAVAFAICLPLMKPFRHVKMPPAIRRWYDVPLRAALVSTLVATVVTLSHTIGPAGSGMLAVYPVVLTSLMLLLHPRIGGRPTAAVIASSGWGLMGFGLALAMVHLTAVPLGSAVSLTLALAICVAWNLGLWSWGRRRVV
ncbi:hypothetical protein [Tardiphaga sp.]|uniref:hypothetical protein n=1 Tax=Tardiphaga sp. TaxID=1926292 RepID=UPI002623965D|nr:hypothetical protein [Tardiphaga sp.]MDB5617279.1 hypothetical protein [Tardiphaga sp.]